MNLGNGAAAKPPYASTEQVGRMIRPFEEFCARAEDARVTRSGYEASPESGEVVERILVVERGDTVVRATATFDPYHHEAKPGQLAYASLTARVHSVGEVDGELVGEVKKIFAARQHDAR